MERAKERRHNSGQVDEWPEVKIAREGERDGIVLKKAAKKSHSLLPTI
jgi:hypothetical protein